MTTDNIIIGVILTVGFLAAYFLLFHDDFVEKRRAVKNLLESKTEAEKIAKVKILSTSSKDIEKFILDNASTLSDATIDALVSRMEMLAADRVIRDDDLKLRIDEVAKEPEDEAAAQVKTSRKRK